MSELKWIKFQDFISPMAVSRYHEFAQLLFRKSEFTQWLKNTALILTGKELIYRPTAFVPSQHHHHHQPSWPQVHHQAVTKSHQAVFGDYDSRLVVRDNIQSDYKNEKYSSPKVIQNTRDPASAGKQTNNHDQDWGKPTRSIVGLLIYRYNVSLDSIEFLVQMDLDNAYRFIVSSIADVIDICLNV